MKCLFIALGVYHAVGGVEKFNQRLLRSLSEIRQAEGLLCRVVALWDQPEHAARAPAGIGFEPCGSRKLVAALKFCRHAFSSQPDVILYGHLLLAPLAFAARLLSPGSRQILIVHGWEVWREPFRRRIPLWERVAVRLGIDEVVSVSRLTMQRMRKAYGLPESRFRVLPNAVDRPAEVRLGRRERSPGRQILSVSRLTKGTLHKGCGEVIQALPLVLERFPDVTYHLVGEGELRPRLEELAEEAGVRRNVQFHGRLDDPALEALYGNVDVFVLPSKKEGFGIVYLEAWKHGLPVIAGNQDAGAEVVTHGYNGLCVDPDSREQIAAALIELLSDPQRAARMGQAGRRTVAEQYSHEAFRDRLAGILLSGARRRRAAAEWRSEEA